MQRQTLTPVAAQERIQTIDIIRGFALLGILIINFCVDHGLTEPWAGFNGFIDQLVYWPIAFLMNDKFLAIYCFLFGLSFTIQMLRAQERNSSFVWIYMRRLIVLYLIGVILQILTNGDILHDYAMAGVLLLALHKLPRKILPLLALLCFLVPWTRQIIKNQKLEALPKNVIVDITILDKYVGVYKEESGTLTAIIKEDTVMFTDGPIGKLRLYAQSDSVFLIKERPVKFSFTPDTSGKFYRLIIEPPGRRIIANRIEMDTKKAQKEITREAQGLRQGKISYKTFVINNAKRFWNELEYWSWKNYFWGFAITGILPLFLMGLYFGRRKVFYDLSANRAFLKKVMKWGLIIGMTSFAIALGFQAWNYFNQVKYESYSFLTRHLMYAAWDFLGVMGMALGYIAGLALLLDKAEWKKRLSFLAPVGRMGLTNYLLQAVIIFITMEPYGLGLNGKAGPAWRLVMALASFIFIFFLSRWWFKHFRIGPAEWIWRSLTYLKFQPMRLKLSDTQSEHSI